jgi:hypothetical protein
MIKASVNLQELRREIYSKAKADLAGSGGVRGRSTYDLYLKAAPGR